VIYTFYSYKGGVGRSMALANVGEWLYRQGLRVVMIDWDLEAPGLESYFYQSPAELEAVRSQLGLIDMLTAYRRMFPRLPLARQQMATSAGAGGAKGANGHRMAETLAVLQEHLPPVTPMLYPVHAPNPSDTSSPALWLLHAGCRAGDRFATYAQSVQDFNWSDFYASFEGEAYFEWLRRQLTAEDLADVVLIDSRTGVTEMGGVCSRQLADVVVSFCVPNLQNLSGVELMARSFRRPELIAQRGRKVEIVMVPTRIDVSELDARNNFEKEFRARLDQFTPPAFGTVKSEFWNLAIQYIPKYAYSEKLAVSATDTARELEEAYKKLAAHLVLLAEGENGARIRRRYAGELQRVFGTMLPSVVIAYADERGKRVADEVRGRLPGLGVSAWPELPPGLIAEEEWRQTAALLDQSRSLVLVVTPGAAHSEKLSRLWRYARQQGVVVFPVSMGGVAGEEGGAALPRWMRHCHDLSGGWEGLATLLQSPPPTARVPFMAPDLPAHYVARRHEEGQLKQALLSEQNAGARSGNIGLWGAAGSGKRLLAAAVCHDEDVQARFGDGILWAKIGTEPDIKGELAELYAALTGERPQFADERDAAARLAERLAEKNCLVVFEDVWELSHLKPCLDAAPRCKRLILTRDLNILTSVSAEAVWVGNLTVEESVALLTAQLNLPPQEAARFTAFAERLGQWPLALKLANGQLRKLLSQGVGVEGALDYLNQALNKLGVLAFDQPNVPDSDESVARSVALTLDHLPEAERERYAQLAFFPPDEVITTRRVAERWRLDEFEAEKLLHRFAELSLVSYDLGAKTVRLHGRLRDYILSPASGYDYNSRYEAAFEHLSAEEQAVARRVLTRLVRLALPNEKAGDTLLRVRLDDFDEVERRTVRPLADTRLVEVEADRGGEEAVQLTGEEVLRNWARLQSWLREDREFLIWRQALGAQLAEWQSHRDRGALLSGVPLQVASTYLKLREVDLSRAERAYIRASEEEAVSVSGAFQLAEENKQLAAQSVQQLQHTRRLGAVIVAALVVFGLVVGSYLLYRAWQAQQDTQRVEQAINLNNQGHALAESRRFGEAVASYQEAIRLKPDYTEAYKNLGDALRETGRTDEAVQAYSRAIELGLNDPAVFAARGKARADGGAFKEAVADFSEAIKRDPADANLYTARSNAHLALNQKEEARQDLETARQLTAPPPTPDDTPGARVTRVYLHYNDLDDRAVVQRLAVGLRVLGYNVPREQLRPERTSGEVRYFNEGDAALANEVSAVVRKSLAAEGAPLNVKTLSVSSPKYTAPAGTIEVWLPSLKKDPPSYDPAQTAPPAQGSRPQAQSPEQKSAPRPAAKGKQGYD
jgi:Flp pilus assembly protein TadD